MDENRTWQKLVAEFIGTAFLIFVGVGSIPALSIARGGEPFTGAELGVIALAFGTVVIAAVYTLGYISGCHINPAVTVGLAVTGKFPWREVPGYLIAQLLGAAVGALGIVGTLGMKASEVGLGVARYVDIPWFQAFTAEFIGTFILVFTVFGVIHRKASPGFAGIAIGLVVFAAIIPIAPATGASINPARTAGPMLIQQLLGGEVHWEQFPVYLIAELLGGVVAGLLFGVIAKTAHDTTSLREALTEKDAR